MNRSARSSRLGDPKRQVSQKKRSNQQMADVLRHAGRGLGTTSGQFTKKANKIFSKWRKTYSTGEDMCGSLYSMYVAVTI